MSSPRQCEDQRRRYWLDPDDHRAKRRQRYWRAPGKINEQQRHYYAVNAEEIRTRKVAKYASDPEYRARVLENNRRSRQKAV